MLPFLKLPVVLAGNPDKNEDDKTAEARIIPSEISSYHDGYYWGAFVYMKGGHTFCTTLTAQQVEKAIKDYWTEITRITRINKNAVKLYQ